MTDANKDFLDAVEIKQALADNQAAVEKLVEAANKEAEKAGRVADETRNRLEELVNQGRKLDERMFAIEQARHGDEDQLDRRSLGEIITETPEFEALMSGKSRSATVEVKTTLTNATINTSQPLVPPDMVAQPQHLPERRLMIADALPFGTTASNLITWPRETFTNNAGPQVSGSPLAYTEGATKPESAFSFSQQTRPVQTIAHFLPVSVQVLEDAPFLQSYLNGRMIYGLRLKLEDQYLKGSGSNGNLQGINTDATAFAAESPDLTGTNKIQRVRSAMRQIELNDYYPSHVVVNPADWYLIETTRINPGTDDRYIMGDPARASRGPLWGLSVIVSNTQTAGTFTVGDFVMGAMVFEKSGLTFGAFYQDGTNVQKNLVTLRAECRQALAVWRTEAFVTGSFA